MSLLHPLSDFSDLRHVSTVQRFNVRSMYESRGVVRSWFLAELWPRTWTRRHSQRSQSCSRPYSTECFDTRPGDAEKSNENNSHWFPLEMLRHFIKWFFQKQHDEDEKGRIQLVSASVNALACYHVLVPSTWIVRFLKESVLLRRLLLNQFHMEGSEIWKKAKRCRSHVEHPWGFTSYTPFNGFQTTPAPGAVSMAAPTPAYSTTLCTTQEAAPAPRAFAEMEESK